MKKTNLVKKFTALSAIGAGMVIALVSPSQAKASWYFNSYGTALLIITHLLVQVGITEMVLLQE